MVEHRESRFSCKCAPYKCVFDEASNTNGAFRDIIITGKLAAEYLNSMQLLWRHASGCIRWVRDFQGGRGVSESTRFSPVVSEIV